MTRVPFPARGELAFAVLLALALPGCPLSDQYYIDPTLGHAGAPSEHAAAGRAPTMVGPKQVPTGGTAGTAPDGSGGTAGTPSNTTAELSVSYPPDCSAKSYGSHVYLLCRETAPSAYVDYTTATTRCESMQSELGLSFGFELTFVESADEQAFLRAWLASAASTSDVIWLGANDIAMAGTWVWGQAPGTPAFFHQDPMGGGLALAGQYVDFAPGEPNGPAHGDENCGAFDGSVNWRWNDELCSGRVAGFLCEETD